ncbi:hypothetical protein NUU61_008845 [Penicillium alfredii]|uniref:Pleckstrin homology domain-containing protein n=1 Tax=Penicillium alfredii TaxID=1506179 RepID=A0A9W9EM92_9EURO|nr:uncharacterized protein NUU61_008845 [Penicillium alfredii]KAJ5084266.1 hypothetical protein NUU61_008845 [Penicillium alfredii]
MATDLQSPVASTAQPSPAPSTSRPLEKAGSRSRPSLCRRDSSPAPSSSPPGLPTPAFSPDGQSDGEDIIEDTLSPFDPRRITPTLHASLVSKSSPCGARTENETLHMNVSQTSQEARSLKHQIQLLEGGTSSAMTELARERDEAVENITDVRKKLDQAQKKARSREEEVERTQTLWDRDREAWDGERRGWERKVHVVEGRLKTVLNEVAAAQEAGTLHSQLSETGEIAKDKAKESDTASVASSSQGRRRTSVTSVSTEEDDGEPDFHNVRYSVMSMAGAKVDSGLNLAQELAFDEEDEFVPSDEDEDETPDSPEALPEERPMSVHSQASHTVASKARKILGLSLQSTGSTTTVDYRPPEPTSPLKTMIPPVEYHDRGIQYSPPPSPEIPAVSEKEFVPPSTELPVKLDLQDEVKGQPEMKDSATLTIATEMVSASCQTVGELPSPPWTPKVTEEPPKPVEDEPEPVQLTSISTQTEPMADFAPVDVDKQSSLSPTSIPTQMDIPMIAIHPPGSEPPSPRNSVVLPPQTKNVSCQANFLPVVDKRSIAIQTEEIRIDQRPVKLPASLLPSAIPDMPPRSEARNSGIQPYRAPPPRSAKRDQRPQPSERPVKPPRAPVAEPVQAYPGNNDNGPLSEDVMSGLRRPLRSSSLFAGFEQLSDDESPDAERDIFTDDELLNRPFASYSVRRGKLVNAKSRPSLDEMTLPEIDEHLSDPESKQSDVGRGSRMTQRSGTTASSSRQSGMRKMAMISSGAVAHQKTRARSPSEPSLDSGSAGSSIAPPFPVPIRLSSRKIPLGGSDGSSSPTRSSVSGRQFSDRGRPQLMRRPTLRRVRSAAAMSQTDATERPEIRSSPARSNSSFAPDSPSYRPPPLPADDITAPRARRGVPKRASIRTTASQHLNHERQDSTGGVQPTSVVDAIAQTMVGEWMFKYVRRRKSFGMGESKDNWEGRNPDEVSANITNSGVRHKRWVWLAPYEGSIMWSSKQPTSGPALLGKSGRKFTIQSVLDVKDDNPLPKGSPNVFNRSILVLTPQRALKFTALTIERHYVWLTALSFLSHSSMGLHDLAALPPVPQEEAGSPAPPQATLRRNPIRDSIRVAKGRPRPMPKGKRSFGSAPVPTPVPELPAGGLDTMAADAPHVPRFSTHNRKRSNTAPRPAPALHAIRSFSSQGTMPSSHSGTTAGSDAYYPPPMAPPGRRPGIASGRSSFSRTSEASGRASSGTGAMFDVGTVRMEAFIDHHAEQINRPRGPPPRRHVRKSSSQWSHGRYDFDAPSLDDSELSFRPDDPFRGF